jgi:glycosyltransferase involved in cell wall biosynthesis
MEAEAFTVPVVATDVSGIPELITHRKTGWLVEERDIAGLARAIKTMMDEPALRLKLAEAGAKDVRARFSSAPGIDTVAKRLNASRPRRKAA